MKYISVHGSLDPAMIDDEDLDIVQEYKWHLNGDGYPMNQLGVCLHRLLGPKLDTINNETHHKDDNKLNNRKSNLVAMPNGSHGMTRGKRSTNKSGYKGVSWRKARNKWIAQIGIGRKTIHLGLFDTAEEAAKEYDRAVKEFYSDTAFLNFPTK